MSTEAALKMFPTPISLASSDTIDKDGGDSEEIKIQSIVIDVAVNGYVATYMFEDMSDEKVIFDDFDTLLEDIRARH